MLAACGGDTTEESGSTTPPDAGSSIESDVEPVDSDKPTELGENQTAESTTIETTDIEVVDINLALGKSTRASSHANYGDAGVYPPHHAVDGTEDTMWLVPGVIFPSHLIVDLGQAVEINRFVQIFTGDGIPDVHFIVEGSLDGTNFTTLHTTNNTDKNLTIKTFDEKIEGTYQYVRITFLGGNGWPNSRQFQVYGPEVEGLPMGVFDLTETEKLAFFKDMMKPIWTGNTMYNESVLMIQEDGELPQAALLFKPIRILSVKNSQLMITYEEGADWFFENGTLFLTENSRAKYMTKNELFPRTSEQNAMGRLGGGLVFWDEYIHYQQLAVTYEHEPDQWKGLIPTSAANQLPNLFHKYKKGEPVKIVLYGDSISVGANSSGWMHVSPFLSPWGELIIESLEKAYPASQTTFANPSVGGVDTDWGVANVETRVNVEDPDLVIIAFGMNDGGRNFSIQKFEQNISFIMDAIQKHNPDVEFILVTTTLPNPEWGLANGQQMRYQPVILSMADQGVAVADITAMHVELLKHKRYEDMTGNNINHPNDFLARIYAQYIIEMLVN